MARSKTKHYPPPAADLPPFAVEAAGRLGIDLTDLRGWALRPDGSVVLLSSNGMKFVVSPV